MSILVALNVFAQCVVHRSSHWICARCRSCLLFTLKAKAKEKALARYLVQLKVRDDESHPASDTLRAPLETPLSASHNHGARKKKKKKKRYNFIEQRSIPPRQPPYLTRSSPTQHHFLQFYSPLLFFRPTPAAFLPPHPRCQEEATPWHPPCCPTPKRAAQSRLGFRSRSYTPVFAGPDAPGCGADGANR
ncbi:hypothetical protein IWZ00DRAFT_77197 [Phyllosticta capitalensis]